MPAAVQSRFENDVRVLPEICKFHSSKYAGGLVSENKPPSENGLYPQSGDARRSPKF
jgi:hypothetical protein